MLNTGGKATVQGVTLETAQAASLEITTAGLLLKTDGEKQSISLSGKLPAHPAVTMDGKRKAADMRRGTLTIAVNAGAHSITIH